MKPSFREATDRLLRCVTADQLAAELGVSRNTIARARMSETAKGHRSPPPGWEAAVDKLARQHGVDLLSLAEALARRASP